MQPSSSVRATAMDRFDEPRLFDLSLIMLLIAAAVFMAAEARYFTVFDDEAFSCRRYTLPAREIVRALWNQAEPAPPLYYLLVHGWIRLFGVTPLAMRSLSIVFFIAGGILIALAGDAWYGRRAGRAACVLAVLHPLHILFG